MKTRIISLIGLLLPAALFIAGNAASAVTGNSPDGETITVYTTNEVYSLATKWVEGYQLANPGQNIQVTKLPDPGMIDQAPTGNSIFFTSDINHPSGTPGTTLQVVVGREIIVPVVSAKNPYLQDIDRQGISAGALALTLKPSGKKTWGELLNNNLTVPVSYIILDNETVRSGVAGFIGADISEKGGMVPLDRDALIASLEKNPCAIGFCRLADIIGPSGATLPASLRLMPIDKNGNGTMEYMEQIYGNLQDFSRGVWIGKYPRQLIQNLYCVSNSEPQSESGLAFLRWVLTSGQEYLSLTGFSNMTSNEQQSQLNKLFPLPVTTAATTEAYPGYRIYLYILIGLVIAGALPFIFKRVNRDKKTSLKPGPGESTLFDEKSLDIPGGLYYDKTHTWAFMEQNGTVKIGIDDFLQHVIGPVTRIEMKRPGDVIKKGDVLCTLVQHGKQLTISAPVSGRITEQNQSLLSDLSAVNRAPYTAGWIYTLEPDNWSREITFLSMAEKYSVWIREEFTRLKDFLASVVSRNSSLPGHVVLQEGGQLRDHVLADLEPPVWEEFQQKFIIAGR